MGKYLEARKLFIGGCNCCQSVILSYCDDLDIDKDLVSNISIGFGGGISGIKGTCGSLVGGIMVIGCYFKGLTKLELYDKCQQLQLEFRNRIGYINCKDIISNLDNSMDNGKKVCCLDTIRVVCDVLDDLFVKGDVL